MSFTTPAEPFVAGRYARAAKALRDAATARVAAENPVAGDDPAQLAAVQRVACIEVAEAFWATGHSICAAKRRRPGLAELARAERVLHAVLSIAKGHHPQRICFALEQDPLGSCYFIEDLFRVLYWLCSVEHSQWRLQLAELVSRCIDQRRDTNFHLLY